MLGSTAVKTVLFFSLSAGTHDAEDGRGDIWYLVLQLPYDVQYQVAYALTGSKSPESSLNIEETGISRHISPARVIPSVTKLSRVARVCCTDEMSTWFFCKNFYTPTGT